jgi:hypothetical protein
MEAEPAQVIGKLGIWLGERHIIKGGIFKIDLNIFLFLSEIRS